MTHGAPASESPLVDELIPPGGHWGRRMAAGEVLRIVDLEGRQAVDFLCYDAERTEERYNAADTMKLAGSIFIGEGTRLLSDMGRTLMTVVADTVGRHDTIGGCCSRESNRLRYGVDDTPNCRGNFLAALKPFGLGKRDIVANVNFFMNVPVEPDGSMAIADGLSKPGDYVELRAETDVIAVLSNCPQTRNPCNGYNPTPIRVVVWRP
ncbi:MAG TPA: urea amidolyase associated protein UAAP1 [Geminicoccaceae bacterium]|nr:urea amidolyase associated protein UAAP1 [Geminicoccaceae bacterium]